MCNAEHHPRGCTCGFGPAYPTGIVGGTVDISTPKKNREDLSIRKARQTIKNVRNIIYIEIKKRRSWVAKLLLCVKAGRIVDQALLPQTTNDVLPGDVVLVLPSDTNWISRTGSNAVRWVDQFISGRTPYAPASHALTALVKAGGKQMYLDHTPGWPAEGPPGGSEIIDEATMMKRYKGRRFHVARPVALVDGEKLMQAAIKEGMKPKSVLGSNLGLFGEDLVCSEVAGIVVAAATGLPFEKQKRPLANITVSDFYKKNKKGIGKYFVISSVKKTRRVIGAKPTE